MAYPYYNPVNYNPSFYPATYTPITPPTPPQTAQSSQQVGGNGLNWVQGEAGAKSYIIAPNTTVLLMDSEEQRFYIKSSDASGMPLPLRVFEYREAQNAAVSEPKAFEGDKYVTHEELARKLAEFASKRVLKKDPDRTSDKSVDRAVKDDE